jgi:hypothetical protein
LFLIRLKTIFAEAISIYHLDYHSGLDSRSIDIGLVGLNKAEVFSGNCEKDLYNILAVMGKIKQVKLPM